MIGLPPPAPRGRVIAPLLALAGGSLFSLVLAMAVLVAACGPTVREAVTGTSQAQGQATSAVPADAEVVTVARVSDGDTFRLRDGRKVRLIGVDTPETVDPNRPEGCWGPEASAHLKATLRPGLTVRLAYERAGTRTGPLDDRPRARIDRHGRTLAYVYRSGGQFLNAELVSQGHAVARYYPPNDDHRHALAAAQARARAAGRGGWGACPDFGEGARP